jgi:hypothetical protein
MFSGQAHEDFVTGDCVLTCIEPAVKVKLKK